MKSGSGNSRSLLKPFGTGRPLLLADWSLDQLLLPAVELDGAHMRVRNLRDCRYRSPRQYQACFADASFPLEELCGVWLVVDHFDRRWYGPAHTMLSFEFESGQFLVVSVEIRRKRGQRWSAVRGMLREYELMYVLSTEEDSILLRTNIRRHPVHLYRVKANPQRIRALLLDIGERVNGLRERPEYYNTVSNNCTNNLLWHIRRIAERSMPRAIVEVLPGYSDRYAYRLGLLDDSLPFEELKHRSLITSRARSWDGKSGFSAFLRREIPRETVLGVSPGASRPITRETLEE